MTIAKKICQFQVDGRNCDHDYSLYHLYQAHLHCINLLIHASTDISVHLVKMHSMNESSILIIKHVIGDEVHARNNNVQRKQF